MTGYKWSPQLIYSIWIESVIERHAHSRVEYMIKAKSQFKRRSTANNVEVCTAFIDEHDCNQRCTVRLWQKSDTGDNPGAIRRGLAQVQDVHRQRALRARGQHVCLEHQGISRFPTVSILESAFLEQSIFIIVIYRYFIRFIG